MERHISLLRIDKYCINYSPILVDGKEKIKKQKRQRMPWTYFKEITNLWKGASFIPTKKKVWGEVILYSAIQFSLSCSVHFSTLPLLWLPSFPVWVSWPVELPVVAIVKATAISSASGIHFPWLGSQCKGYDIRALQMKKDKQNRCWSSFQGKASFNWPRMNCLCVKWESRNLRNGLEY